MPSKPEFTNPEEAKVELITAVLMIAVFALFLLFRLDESLAMLAGGLILLGSGAYQSSKRWHVAVTTWILGLILFFGGLGVRMFLVTYLQINWVAIGLLAVGAYLLYQWWPRSR